MVYGKDISQLKSEVLAFHLTRLEYRTWIYISKNLPEPLGAENQPQLAQLVAQ